MKDILDVCLELFVLCLIVGVVVHPTLLAILYYITL